MASATADQQPFRFLHLPTELRCRVYENIEFPITWHILDRKQALINKRDWLVPPQAQIYDSTVTLIRLQAEFAIEILATCRLVKEEACPILIHRVEHCKTQPLRYIVDYSAARALVAPWTALRSCLGVADGGIGRSENAAVRTFLSTSALFLSRNHPAQNGTQNGSRDVQAIEVTITHKSGVVYEKEVLETMMSPGELQRRTPNRLVFIHKSPLPRIRRVGDTQAKETTAFEKLVLQQVPREPDVNDHASSDHGGFVRPLEEAAFAKHLEGLEVY